MRLQFHDSKKKKGGGGGKNTTDSRVLNTRLDVEISSSRSVSVKGGETSLHVRIGGMLLLFCSFFL